jgi:hypothetical protein
MLLSKISLAKLLSGDQAESEAVFRASKAHGFFLLDLQNSAEGEELLEQAEKIFGVSKDLFEEGVEELTKFVQPPPAMLGSVAHFSPGKRFFRADSKTDTMFLDP